MWLKSNTKLIIEYDGSNYPGWQRLNNIENKEGIQWVLENVISDYLKEEIKVIGSGRTDAGVHALGQTVNFHSKNLVEPHILMSELNQRLPEDIRIRDAKTVSTDFHSRYMARQKTYEYRIDNGEVPNVFTRKYAYHVPEVLNIGAMEQAAGYLIGTHDFRSFTSEKDVNKSTIRTIDSIVIYPMNSKNKRNSTTNCSNELGIRITGNGFLYHMVRILVGTLLEVGSGLKQQDEIPQILEGKNRQLAGKTVSSHALFLVHVEY